MNKHHAPSGPTGFDDPARLPGALSADRAAAILGAVGDLAFVLDGDGRILDIAVSQRELAAYGVDRWRGADLAETVTVESKPKVAEMLVDAVTAAPHRWRQVNHPTPMARSQSAI